MFASNCGLMPSDLILETDITANAATRLASTAALTSTSSTSSLSQTSQNQGQTGRPTMPNVNVQGLSSIPGLTGEMVNSIVQSVLQAHGEIVLIL